MSVQAAARKPKNQGLWEILAVPFNWDSRRVRYQPYREDATKCSERCKAVAGDGANATAFFYALSAGQSLRILSDVGREVFLPVVLAAKNS